MEKLTLIYSQEDFMDRVTRLETSNLGTNEATLEERVLSDDDDVRTRLLILL